MNPDSRLLHLPQSSRYAVSAALYLASVPPDGFHLVGKIAALIGLSPSYLAKILQRLALKGILESRLGAKGGYRLSRPAAELTLSEIVGASHSMDKGEMPCMIEARACDCGKLNVVAARGMNDDELGAFAALTQKRPLHVRFIELMPMGDIGFFSEERRIPLAEMSACAGPLEPVAPEGRPVGHGPARDYRRPGAAGTVGFLSAMSCGFCEACNRMRLSSIGTLIPCLDGEAGVDLRGPLRAGAGARELEVLILDAVRLKPEAHRMLDRASTPEAGPRFVCQILG